MIPVLEVATLGGVVPEERRGAAGSRRKILGAARKLFKSRGVDAVSMHEVRRAAGVGQGTLYRRFEHNADLLGAIRDAAGGERRVEMYQDPFYGWLRAIVIALLRQAERGGEIKAALDLE